MTTGPLLSPRAIAMGRQVTYTFPGPVAANPGTLVYHNDTGWPWKILAIRATLTVNGTTTTTVDVNINGTSIFTAGGDRPSLASGVQSVKVLPTAADRTVEDGEYLAVDIDVAGTGAQGLMVTMVIQ